jgi:hypothetical protein
MAAKQGKRGPGPGLATVKARGGYVAELAAAERERELSQGPDVSRQLAAVAGPDDVVPRHLDSVYGLRGVPALFVWHMARTGSATEAARLAGCPSPERDGRDLMASAAVQRALMGEARLAVSRLTHAALHRMATMLASDDVPPAVHARLIDTAFKAGGVIDTDNSKTRTTGHLGVRASAEPVAVDPAAAQAQLAALRDDLRALIKQSRGEQGSE